MQDSPSPTLRAFVGSAIPPLLAQPIARLQHTLPSLPGWRWTPEENLHLTLRFLGQLSSSELDSLGLHLARIQAAPINIRFTRGGSFERGGILFIDIERSPALLSLQSLVEQAAARIGLPPETRPYHPHITVARSPRTAPHRDAIAKLDELLANLPDRQFTAESFLLYQSVSGHYRPLRRFDLKA